MVDGLRLWQSICHTHHSYSPREGWRTIGTRDEARSEKEQKESINLQSYTSRASGCVTNLQYSQD